MGVRFWDLGLHAFDPAHFLVLGLYFSDRYSRFAVLLFEAGQMRGVCIRRIPV